MNRPLTEDQKQAQQEMEKHYMDVLPHSWPHEARITASICLSFMYVRYEYSDNFRWCRVTIPAELADYCQKQNKGCCGEVNEVFFENGEPYMVGCNYGH